VSPHLRGGCDGSPNYLSLSGEAWEMERVATRSPPDPIAGAERSSRVKDGNGAPATSPSRGEIQGEHEGPSSVWASIGVVKSEWLNRGRVEVKG